MQKHYKWCCANELQINSEKSEALMIPSQISAPKTDLIIAYNDSPIIICIEILKYLGIKLDSKLNYKPHIRGGVLENVLGLEDVLVDTF